MQFTYDNRDNLIMLQDPNNGVRYFFFDKNNRMVTSARPMGEQTAYAYDAVGNKTAVVDAKNQRIEYTYNQANRLAGINIPGQGQVSYAYDAVNWNSPAAMLL